MRPVASRVKAIAPSPTVRLGSLANELKAQGKDVINLGIGEPDFPTPAHIVEAGQKAMTEVPMTKYVSSIGLKDLREAVAEKSRRENGIPAQPDNVLVAPTKHCIFLAAMALGEPGGEGLMPAPRGGGWWGVGGGGGWGAAPPPPPPLGGGRPVAVPAADEARFVLEPDALAEA